MGSVDLFTRNLSEGDTHLERMCVRCGSVLIVEYRISIGLESRFHSLDFHAVRMTVACEFSGFFFFFFARGDHFTTLAALFLTSLKSPSGHCSQRPAVSSGQLASRSDDWPPDVVSRTLDCPGHALTCLVHWKLSDFFICFCSAL